MADVFKALHSVSNCLIQIQLCTIPQIISMSLILILMRIEHHFLPIILHNLLSEVSAFFPQTDLTFLKGGQIQPSVNVEHTSSEAGKIPEAQLTAQNCQNLCILFKSFYMCIQA